MQPASATKDTTIVAVDRPRPTRLREMVRSGLFSSWQPWVVWRALRAFDDQCCGPATDVPSSLYPGLLPVDVEIAKRPAPPNRPDVV